LKFLPQRPPREFSVGTHGNITLWDHGKILLDPNEQVTFQLAGGAEHDVTRKEWGLYATASLNGRLEQSGLRGVLVKNKLTRRYFLLLVERGKEANFEEYCHTENLKTVAWLDSTRALQALEQRVKA